MSDEPEPPVHRQGRPVVFMDLKPDEFPFTVEIFHGDDPDGLRPLFQVIVDGPGALNIPGLRQPGDPPCWARVTYPDRVTELRD